MLLSSEPEHNNRCIKLISIIVILQFILTIVITVKVGLELQELSPITSELGSTLNDVQILLPEANRTLLILGKLTPGIARIFNILEQLCNSNSQCHIQS